MILVISLLGTNLVQGYKSPVTPKKIKILNYKNFSILFDAVTDIFPPFFSYDLKYIMTYKRYWNTYLYKLDSDYNGDRGNVHL